MTDLPENLVRFRAELEGAIARDLGRRRRRARAARTLAAAGLAAAGIAASVVLAGGGGPSIVDRAQAALALDDGAILHTRVAATRASADGAVLRWQEEAWQLGGDHAARREVETTADGRRFETALTADGQAQIYDPATATIYSEGAAAGKARLALGGKPAKPAAKPAGAPPASKRQLPEKATRLGSRVQAPQTPQDKIRLLLRTGKLRDAGHLTVAGRDAIRLVSDSGELVVDASTFAPIEWTVRGPGGAVTLRFEVYETMAASAVNERLVSLTAQHPGATVDSSASDFAAAAARLPADLP